MRLAAGSQELLVPYISYQVIIWDIQKCIGDLVVPTEGLTFDADHAACLPEMDVFVCRDEKLTETLKTLAKHIEKESGGAWHPAVVSNAKQLAARLGV